MAEKGATAAVPEEEEISCSICLDQLKDPVTTPCGHSYCMGCIKDCWDKVKNRRNYTCPLCNEKFTKRPVLKRNTVLSELVEKMQKVELQAPRFNLAVVYAGPGDVTCDVCTGKKQKAIKSCLTCLASFCGPHLMPHYESIAFKRHNLEKVSSQLQDKICTRHDEVMKMFCNTDQQRICYLCSMDEEHKGHDTVAYSTAAERNETLPAEDQSDPERLMKIIIQERMEVQQKIRERERELKTVQGVVVEFFTNASRVAMERRPDIKTQKIAQTTAAVAKAEGILEKLEAELTVLRRKNDELYDDLVKVRGPEDPVSAEEEEEDSEDD